MNIDIDTLEKQYIKAEEELMNQEIELLMQYIQYMFEEMSDNKKVSYTKLLPSHSSKMLTFTKRNESIYIYYCNEDINNKIFYIDIQHTIKYIHINVSYKMYKPSDVGIKLKEIMERYYPDYKSEIWHS